MSPPALEPWFDATDIHPLVVHEFEDSAVLKVFGKHGEGLFAAPTAIEEKICRQYRVRSIGRIDDVKEQFYAISVESRVKHPAVIRIFESARTTLFGESEAE